MTDRLTIAMHVLARNMSLTAVYAPRDFRAALGLADALIAAAGETPAEKPVVPPVVPVKFDENDFAHGDDWNASVGKDNGGWMALTIDLRPGEDAGDVTARMLAVVGRGP